jgi:hypothetical protein
MSKERQPGNDCPTTHSQIEERRMEIENIEMDMEGGSFRLRTIKPDADNEIVNYTNVVLEFRNSDGEWKKLPGLQSFKYEVNTTTCTAPKIEITLHDFFYNAK